MSNQSSPRFFYGWAIVAFTFAVQFVTMGTVFYAYGVLLKPLTETLDADRFLISLALSLQMAFGALLGPLVGKLIAERSIRVLMMCGCATMSLGFLALSQAQTLWHLYLAFGVILSTSMALTGPLPNNALLANWFVRRRGTALGVSQFGISFSGTVLVPLTTWLVLSYGWRSAVSFYAIVPVVVLMPLAWKFAVKRPEDMGLFPDGDPEGEVISEAGQPDGWTVGRAFRDRRIWLLALIVGPSFMSITSVLIAMHSHVTDQGMSALQASAVVALMTFMGALAKPLFGTLSDFVDKRLVMGLSLICQIVGLLVIIALESYVGIMAGAFLFGLGYGAVMPLWGVLLGAMFGREAFARIMGSMGPIMLPFTLLGLPFTTWVFEQTGSYAPAFATLVAGFVLSTIALGFLRLPAEPARPETH
ncbi:MAG: MFS transporter [Gammaproteobacteria bacterium]|nr:MFS transporter [Gammaproteobacteria bacterium]